MVDLTIAPPVGAGMVRLCETSEVPQEGGLRIPLSGRGAIAVFRSGGRYYVTDDLCTHGGASLSEGLIEDDEVECPFHLGRFCLRTGAVMRAPCTDPLKTYPAEVRHGHVYAALHSEAR
jgi:nitrite reductase/ring-hydroxylating ferredoxin subunit